MLEKSTCCSRSQVIVIVCHDVHGALTDVGDPLRVGDRPEVPPLPRLSKMALATARAMSMSKPSICPLSGLRKLKW
jgi:hypothetical protein